jgi:hypothetical protein
MKNAQDADVGDPARETASEGQADAGALGRPTLLAEGKRMELVFCSAKPSERARGLAFFCHTSILGPTRESERVFDRRMPVL